MKRTVEYLGKNEDGFAEYEISESYEDDATATVYRSKKIPKPKESQPEPTSYKGFLKLNKEEFLKTEFGAKLKSTLELLDWNLTMTWDCNNYRDKDAIKRLRAQWDIFKLALKQFYGIEYAFTRTDEYFGVCAEDESDWLFKVDRKIDGKGE